MSFHSLCKLLVVALPIVASYSCAVDLSQGRPGGVATLVTTSAQSSSGYSTEIHTIDGVKVNGGEFKLSVGRHVVEVGGRCVTTNKAAVGVLFGPVGAAIGALADYDAATRSGLLQACFIARPDRTYEVRTFSEGGAWKIEIVDQTTTYDVKSPCKPATPPTAKS